MNIELNFDKKVVTIKEDTNIVELVDKLINMLPDYSKWKLTSITINSNIYNPIPITVNEPKIGHPWWEIPHVTCGNGNYTNIRGVYNIEIN